MSISIVSSVKFDCMNVCRTAREAEKAINGATNSSKSAVALNKFKDINKSMTYIQMVDNLASSSGLFAKSTDIPYYKQDVIVALSYLIISVLPQLTHSLSKDRTNLLDIFTESSYIVNSIEGISSQYTAVGRSKEEHAQVVSTINSAKEHVNNFKQAMLPFIKIANSMKN